MEKNPECKIVEKSEGFYVIVDGKWFGFWRSKPEARAGMETEIKRRRESRPPGGMKIEDIVVPNDPRFCRGKSAGY